MHIAFTFSQHDWRSGFTCAFLRSELSYIPIMLRQLESDSALASSSPCHRFMNLLLGALTFAFERFVGVLRQNSFPPRTLCLATAPRAWPSSRRFLYILVISWLWLHRRKNVGAFVYDSLFSRGNRTARDFQAVHMSSDIVSLFHIIYRIATCMCYLVFFFLCCLIDEHFFGAIACF